MDLLNPEYLIRVFLVFVRISGFFLAAPFFGHASVPVRVRILLAVILAYALSGLVTSPLPARVEHSFGLMASVGIEALTGAALGFAAQFIFWAVQYAGELLGFQMGLSLAEVFDPSQGTNANPLGRLLGWIFLLAFLLFDGHHYVLTALVGSFQALPLAGAH
ncbi:MAG TPA: flagellar biosynthetic protein FliR, partial [Rhodothermales bacterium]